MIQPAEIGRMGYPDLPGRNRVTVAGGLASGVQPAMDLAQSRARALSAMPGNRRRTSIATDDSPSDAGAAINALAALLRAKRRCGYRGRPE